MNILGTVPLKLFSVSESIKVIKLNFYCWRITVIAMASWLIIKCIMVFEHIMCMIIFFSKLFYSVLGTSC